MKPMLLRLLCLIGLGMVLHTQAVVAQGGSAAQSYPAKPVRLVVGYSPGGLPDTIARILAQKLGERWKQQVIVENKPGANGNLAADHIAKSAGDGYTLLVADSGTTAINPFLYAKLPFDPEKDLIPVVIVARAPLFLAVHSSVPANTFPELVALVKSKPGEFSYGSSGIGSIHHLCMEYLKSALGMNITHVPFKGTGKSVPALVAGQSQRTSRRLWQSAAQPCEERPALTAPGGRVVGTNVCPRLRHGRDAQDSPAGPAEHLKAAPSSTKEGGIISSSLRFSFQTEPHILCPQKVLFGRCGIARASA